ncbi:hypothetical protein FULANO1_76 [Escherichia phage vB_EcoD_Fulano1]|uniref:Uncharacterized protein n=1 Tax=Escherichia phage vB_EcoD_Fulano1 TaxID=2902670 RepID=A0AC61TRD0_9CAUD|nr:hypothetical protein FULANO1_76 [Escherichia phage vB_EcoD_Fulano1]
MIWLLVFLVVFFYISGLFIFRALVKTCDCTDKDQPLVLMFWFVWFWVVWFWVALYQIVRDKSGFKW